MVLHYCPGGELFFYLQNLGGFPEHILRFYASNILLGLECLHKKHIAYWDLKPENVLVDSDGYAWITDFGLSKENISDEVAMSFCGTPEYLAPETILRTGTGKPADWWAFGCIVFEMLVGIPPFYTQNRLELYESIKSKEINFSECEDLIKRKASPDLIDLI